MEHRLFTTEQFLADGNSRHALAWGNGRRWINLRRGVWAKGLTPPTPFEVALASSMASKKPARGLVAAQLSDLDGIVMPKGELPRLRTEQLAPGSIVRSGVECVDGLQLMLDLAALLRPVEWEQALESALFKRLLQLEELENLLPELSRRRHHGVGLIRQVLALRPPGAPPTESLLETLMVQLARVTDGVPEPTRQRVVRNEHDEFVARVDLCWPEEGGFNELDGEHHKGQPVYDANRQTEVTIVTGWLCGRFSWTEVRYNPVPTGRRLQRFIATAKSLRH